MLYPDTSPLIFTSYFPQFPPPRSRYNVLLSLSPLAFLSHCSAATSCLRYSGSKFLTHLTLPLLPYYPTSIAPHQIYHVFNVLSPVLHLNIFPGISPQPPALHPNIFPKHFIWHPSSSIFLKRPAAIRHFFQCLHLPPLPQQIKRFSIFPNTLPRILPLRSPPSLPAFPQRLAASLRALQFFALFRLRHTPLLFTSSSPPPILHSKIAHIFNTPPLVLHPNILPPLTSPALPSHCSAATFCLRYSIPQPLTPLTPHLLPPTLRPNIQHSSTPNASKPQHPTPHPKKNHPKRHSQRVITSKSTEKQNLSGKHCLKKAHLKKYHQKSYLGNRTTPLQQRRSATPLS